MSNLSFISVATLAILSHNGNCDKSIEIEFINEYINKFDLSRSVLLTAFLCWTQVEKYVFLKNVSNNFHRASILNISGEIFYSASPAQNVFYLLDLDCENSEEILLAANGTKSFGAPYQWLLLTKHPYSTKNDIFKTLNIFPDSHVVVAEKFKSNAFHMIELYRYSSTNDEVVYRRINTWNSGKGFETVKPRVLAMERKNINGTLLKSTIVILNNDTKNHLDDYRFKHIDTIAKVNYVFTNHMIDFVNGTREFMFVDSWGYKDKTNNSYTGMIGTLERNEAEIGATALFITADRVPVIEYASLTTPTRAKFIFRQPPLSYVANVFTLPFSRGVWFAGAGLVVLAAVLLQLTVYWEWHEPALAGQKDLNALRDSFSDAVMVALGAVAQQGAPTEPRSTAGKTVMIFTFIALMFLYVSYSANIVALLQSSATSIRTLEDLLNSRLELGVDDTVYNHYYFKTATEPIRRAIYEKKVAPRGQRPHFMPMSEGIARVRQGFFAFQVELGRAYKLVGDTFLESEKCGLQEIAYLQVVDPYLAIRKRSSYKEPFKLALRRVQEAGLQMRELRRLYTARPLCHSAGGSFVSVGLLDAYFAFLVLAAGMALSTLVLVAERILYNHPHLCRTPCY